VFVKNLYIIMPDRVAMHVLANQQDMENERRPHERAWQDIRDLVRTNTKDLNRLAQSGQLLTDHIFDATAPQAMVELASGLQSYLTNPAERWFSLEIEGGGEVNQDLDVLAWLEVVADIIFHAYSDEDSTFNGAFHEGYLDVVGMGTEVIYQEWDNEERRIVFKSFPIADIWFAESKPDNIDIVHRKTRLTVRQMRNEYGRLPADVSKKKDTDVFDVIHAVYPRSERNPLSYSQGNKAFASCHVCVQTKDTLRESGYDTMPYHIARWMKVPDETYGRGPAHDALPDIKMLNMMEKVLIKAGQKIVDPPLQLDDDGFLLPIVTSPGALIFKQPGTEPIQPLETKGQIPMGLELSDRKREQIRKAFYSEWLKMEKQNKEMTAFEVKDRRDEKLRLLAPQLGRLQSELLGKCLRRSYHLLNQFNVFPPAPSVLQGRRLKVVYVSPAAKAQQGSKATEMGQYVQDLIPLAQIQPDIMDVIDMDKFAAQLALARGTSRTILRNPREVAQIRAQRAKQQQMQQMMGAAEPASKAIKNLADAGATGGQLGGLAP
jgi:hypothetical protein